MKKIISGLKRVFFYFSKKGSVRKISDIEAEEHLYEIVEQEIKQGEIRRGLWTKAEAQSNSTDSAAIRAKYIQYRFGQLEAQGQATLRMQKKPGSGKRGWWLVGSIIFALHSLGPLLDLDTGAGLNIKTSHRSQLNRNSKIFDV